MTAPAATWAANEDGRWSDEHRGREPDRAERSRPDVGTEAAQSNSSADFKLASSVHRDSDEVLARSAAALMAPPASTKPKPLPAPPRVFGRGLCDLRVRDAWSWDSRDEVTRRARRFWCSPGADVLLVVSAGLPALPDLVETILEREPGSVEVQCTSAATVAEWVAALAGERR